MLGQLPGRTSGVLTGGSQLRSLVALLGVRVALRSLDVTLVGVGVAHLRRGVIADGDEAA